MFTDADIIYSYTRREAIEDGVLVDLMQDEIAPLVREAGFTIPLAMTTAAYQLAVWPLDDPEAGQWLESKCQDGKGRLWDVLFVLRFQIRSSGNTNQIDFSVMVCDWQSKRRKTIHLKAICGPGDDAEPVITIMLPEED